MIGWRYIGQTLAFWKLPAEQATAMLMASVDRPPALGDIVCFTYDPLASFRCGWVRVRSIEATPIGVVLGFDGPVRQVIHAACAQDHLFVATAIGENVFRRRV